MEYLWGCDEGCFLSSERLLSPETLFFNVGVAPVSNMVVAAIGWNNVVISKSSAEARACSCSIDGMKMPFSMRPMVARLRPESWESSAWVRFFAVRCSWMALDIISSVVSFLMYEDIGSPWHSVVRDSMIVVAYGHDTILNIKSQLQAQNKDKKIRLISHYTFVLIVL